MIAGIGVDIAETARFESLYRKYGDRIVRRLLTAAEREQIEHRSHPERFLATRFAAKEAAVKALGTGFDQGVGFKSIEVKNNGCGKPDLVFHNQARELIIDRKINAAHLSISDEKHYVVAMVVLESG